MIINLFSIFVILIILTTNGYTWDDELTHPKLTEKVIERTAKNLNLYLKNKLEINEGIDAQFMSEELEPWSEPKTIQEWIEYGAKMEDSPACRASNHFHNPLLGWDVSGLNDPCVLINSCYLSDYPPNQIRSNVLWATGYLGPAPDGERASNYNDWDWENARQHFYVYLTGRAGSVIIDEKGRENRLAMCFQSLGQVLHLLQDMAVPAHVRNDFSVGHESMVTDEGRWYTLNKWLGNRFEAYVKSKTEKDPEGWFEIPYSVKLNGINLTNLWDTDIYTGDNCNVSLDEIGLAEYANMNFVSTGAMFTDGFLQDDDPDNDIHYFPYPMEGCTDFATKFLESPASLVAEDGKTDQVIYLSKVNCGQIIDHFVLPSYFAEEISGIDGGVARAYKLDEECYKDYAELLIPRAIGYSTALIDYFFRGSLKITSPDHAVYSITDGAMIDPEINAQTFTNISLNVQNDTPGKVDSDGNILSYEPMENGNLIAVAKYKKRSDYLPDLSGDPPSADSRESGFSYSISQPIAIQSLSSDEAIQFDFDFSSDPIPANITDLYLQVVFQGTLGKEKDTAIAVGLKDLNEPQHICITNSTDRFFLDGNLYTSNEILADSNLKKRVTDADIFYSIFPINDMKYELSFSSQSDNASIVHAAYEPLPSGSYGRLLVLTDQDAFYVTIRLISESTGIDIIHPPRLINGVTYQENEEHVFISNATFDRFRGVNYHFTFNHFSAYPDDIGYDTVSWPILGNESPRMADYIR